MVAVAASEPSSPRVQVNVPEVVWLPKVTVNVMPPETASIDSGSEPTAVGVTAQVPVPVSTIGSVIGVPLTGAPG